MIKKRLLVLNLFSCSLIALTGCTAETSTSSSNNTKTINLLANSDFSQGVDGWWAAGGSLKAVDNIGCISFTESGSNPWDVILGQSGLALKQGENYTLRFDAMAQKAINVKTIVQHDGAPYTSYLVQDVHLPTSSNRFIFLLNLRITMTKCNCIFRSVLRHQPPFALSSFR